MDFKDLTEEQSAKVVGAHTPEDILRIAQEEGYELSDEEMEQVAGGIFGWDDACPKCGSGNLYHHYASTVCLDCGWSIDFA